METFAQSKNGRRDRQQCEEADISFFSSAPSDSLFFKRSALTAKTVVWPFSQIDCSVYADAAEITTQTVWSLNMSTGRLIVSQDVRWLRPGQASVALRAKHVWRKSLGSLGEMAVSRYRGKELTKCSRFTVHLKNPNYRWKYFGGRLPFSRRGPPRPPLLFRTEQRHDEPLPFAGVFNEPKTTGRRTDPEDVIHSPIGVRTSKRASKAIYIYWWKFCFFRSVRRSFVMASAGFCRLCGPRGPSVCEVPSHPEKRKLLRTY